MEADGSTVLVQVPVPPGQGPPLVVQLRPGDVATRAGIEDSQRLEWKRDALVATALRFGLVGEQHLRRRPILVAAAIAAAAPERNRRTNSGRPRPGRRPGASGL
jgi:hypothetical protein